MFIAISVAVLLVLASVALHYEALRVTSGIIPRLVFHPQRRILLILLATLLVHVLSISLFAVSYYVLSEYFGLGSLRGDSNIEPIDYFYFSATTYTTLGIGDVAAQGPMRIIAAMESLAGLVLISWSATFTYMHMERFWTLHEK